MVEPADPYETAKKAMGPSAREILDATRTPAERFPEDLVSRATALLEPILCSFDRADPVEAGSSSEQLRNQEIARALEAVKGAMDEMLQILTAMGQRLRTVEARLQESAPNDAGG